MAKGRLQPFRCFDQLTEIETRLEASALKHVDNILGRDISRRRGRKWAAANAATAGINDIDSGLDSGGDIGQSGAARVVKVQAQIDVRRFHPHTFNHIANIPGRGDADCVTKTNLGNAGALGLCRKIGDHTRIDFACIRITKRH